MADNQIQVKLEQRDWERLQKLSERNGESMELLVAKMVERELARTFNKPPDVPSDSEVRKVYESFVEGRTQKELSLNEKAELIGASVLEGQAL